MNDNNIYNVEYSSDESPKSLKAILEEFIHITVEYANDTEMIHIYGDRVLLDTLKYILLNFPEAGPGDYPADPTLSKIITMFENNPRWYS